nr:hypothetical protein [Asticcacaulis taihuensis]
MMDDSLATLSPLEQRRMRLRAYADRVLEAVEALPMPKTALEGERSLRAITACDRMLIQIYNKVARQQQIQQNFMPPVARTTIHGTSGRSCESPAPMPHVSRPPEARTEPHSEFRPEPRENDGEAVPFVYAYDDDEIDEGPEEPPEEPPENSVEPLSPTAQAALDLEEKANAIFAEYLRARAAEDSKNDPP